MSRHKRPVGLTRIEVVMVLGIFVCLGIIVLPAVEASREASRTSLCLNNLKQLGLALKNYESSKKCYPPSSGVTRDAQGKITAVDGWSWTVAVLPYLELDSASQESLTAFFHAGGRLPRAEGAPHADGSGIRLSELLCPSYGGDGYADPATRKEAITNYKAMGATHIESLSVASAHPLIPRYDPVPRSNVRALHPDGTLFPGSALRLGDFRKGSSYTIVVAESLEPRFARWTVGAEAATVGLPPDIEFEKYQRGSGRQFVPKGYAEARRGDAKGDGVYWTYRPFAAWNPLSRPYSEADGIRACQYGPSSGHPSGVIRILT